MNSDELFKFGHERGVADASQSVSQMESFKQHRQEPKRLNVFLDPDAPSDWRDGYLTAWRETLASQGYPDVEIVPL